MPSGRRRRGIVADLWRFPVKSFGGERLRRAFVGPFGLIGDRRYAIDAGDGPLTARRTPKLLGFCAGYGEGQAAERATVTLPDGEVAPVGDERLLAAVGQAIGADVSVVDSPMGIFDAAPLHLLGEPSIAALGDAAGMELDRRRFRANILVEPDSGEPFAEDAWIGERLAIGDAVVEVVVNTERCAVTTFDPDTGERHPDVLRALATTRENLFGIYARVVRPGWIATGDPIDGIG